MHATLEHLAEAANRVDRRWQVMLEGGADNDVAGVEVTVRQVVTHAHDVLLGDAWLRAIVEHWRQDPGLAELRTEILVGHSRIRRCRKRAGPRGLGGRRLRL